MFHIGLIFELCTNTILSSLHNRVLWGNRCPEHGYLQMLYILRYVQLRYVQLHESSACSTARATAAGVHNYLKISLNSALYYIQY